MLLRCQPRGLNCRNCLHHPGRRFEALFIKYLHNDKTCIVVEMFYMSARPR
jgi:hypothetical protein